MVIIPQPQKMTMAGGEGRFYIPYDGKIVIENSCGLGYADDALLLQREMEQSIGFGLGITAGASKKCAVRLMVDESLDGNAYHLQVSDRGVEITGGKDAGLFYGTQTLRQILRQEGAALPFLAIEDWSESANRGYYFDVTRGRIPTLDYLKQMADRMAFYKMNQLQLYIEHSFLFENLSEVWRDDTPLSAQDILELDAYCRKLHIELVPSLSCFGHLYKVLRTKSFGELCELENPDDAPFSFSDRMAHHTVNVTDERSFQFITSLIDEYLPLFTSKKFNIGADETFDLGKGKSRQQAEKVGAQRLYVDYVKKLCEYLVEKGRQPMFWGDIICSFPEAICELPEETICLNWGYDPKVSDESIRKVAEAGKGRIAGQCAGQYAQQYAGHIIRQYVCPGVQGWNQFVNALDDAYENIRRMCHYGKKYGAEGILVTDWGDFGHINHPDFSVPAMIYGAAFSWNSKGLECGKINCDEINRQISVLEYGDASGEFVSLVAKIGRIRPFDWWNAVAYIEGHVKAPDKKSLAKAGDEIERLSALQEKLCRHAMQLNDWGKGLLKPYLVAIDGMKLVQRIGLEVADAALERELTEVSERRCALASDLENWYLHFKEVWRSVSREAELYRVGEVVFRYADLLRGCKK